jgi:hypothetical protein
MPTPDFLGPAARRSSGMFELVHVESGAVLASRVLAGGGNRGRWRSRQPVRPGDDEVFVAAPSRWVQTCFRPDPIDAVFVAADGTILRAHHGLKPWRLAVLRAAYAVIEAPRGFLERTGTQVGDRVAVREAQAARPARGLSPLRGGFEEVPESVRTAVRQMAAEIPSDEDPDADPWDLGAAEPPPSSPRSDLGPHETLSPAASPVHAHRASGAAIGTGPARRRAQVRGATLAQLLDRRTPIEWFEAVAIIQGLSHVLLEEYPSSDPGVPKADEVAIAPEGHVELLARGLRDAPVARAARLLHELSEGAALPVQLRLLVLQEISPSPCCQSILEFSTRLALFERPGRADIIRGVYERYLRLPPQPAEGAAPVAAPPAPKMAAREPWWRTRLVRAGGVAALLSGALLAGVSWGWRSGSPLPTGTVDRRGPVARTVGDVRLSVAEAAAEGAKSVSRWLGLESAERPAPAPTAAALEAPPVPQAAPSRLPVRTAPAPPAPVSAAARVAAPPPALPDVKIYSGIDGAVVPPSLLRSRLPSEPPPGVRADALPEVEIVVSETGEVESVKLLTPQAGVGPSMMLSAIKTWRFHPASLDGEPVRYRLRMRLTGQ